jgi:hypothetical protein
MSYTLNNIKSNHLIALGLPNDADYLTYVNDQSNTNHGKLQSIEEYFNTDNLNTADSILSDFIDTNSIETNLKQVYSLYLKSQYGDTLSNSDSTYLYDLGFADPLQNGDAVVSAAVLLDLDIPWIISEPKKNEKVEMPEMNIGKILIQPNPTKDKITVQFECETIDKKYQYEIYNSVGEIVLNGVLFCDNRNEIDLSVLQNSVFILVIKSLNTRVGTYKIVKE